MLGGRALNKVGIQPLVYVVVDGGAVEFVQDLVAVVLEESDLDVGHAGLDIVRINLFWPFSEVAHRISVAGYDKYRQILRDISEGFLAAVKNNC